jgi:hypothetical protein
VWLSSEDLRKGLQWLPELNKKLSSTRFGLLVLTSDNRDAPWIVFEAGVISKALPERHCCPLLCDLKQTDMSGPLTQFQSATIGKKEDMLQLVRTMNDASGASKVEEERLNKWFETHWRTFEEQVSKVLASRTASSIQTPPTDRSILEQILETVRSLAIEPRARVVERHPFMLDLSRSKLPPRFLREVIDIVGDPRFRADLLHHVHRLAAHQRHSEAMPPSTGEPQSETQSEEPFKPFTDDP